MQVQQIRSLTLDMTGTLLSVMTSPWWCAKDYFPPADSYICEWIVTVIDKQNHYWHFVLVIQQVATGNIKSKRRISHTPLFHMNTLLCTMHVKSWLYNGKFTQKESFVGNLLVILGLRLNFQLFILGTVSKFHSKRCDHDFCLQPTTVAVSVCQGTYGLPNIQYMHQISYTDSK